MTGCTGRSFKKGGCPRKPLITKFFAYSGGKPIAQEWQPPDIPDTADTDALADIHQDFHRWILDRHGPDAFEVKSRIALETSAVRGWRVFASDEKNVHFYDHVTP